MKLRYRTIVIIITVLLIAGSLLAEDRDSISDKIYDLNDSVMVTGSRTPTSYDNLARNIFVLDSKQISERATSSVAGLLSSVGSVDIRQRGPFGVQSDISIRGASFEQTLVLIDGIKVTDPQTGHHNMDLPLALADIDRIEVLRGSGSRLYGPNAMGGVINILTAKAAGTGISWETMLGEHGYYNQRLGLSLKTGSLTHQVSISQAHSDGYIVDSTNFDILTLGLRSGMKMGRHSLNLAARYCDKEFGAYKFYSDRFPNQWEATETGFFSADFQFVGDGFKLQPQFYWRQHKDEFHLERNDSSRYPYNQHTTDQSGVELQFTADVPAGILALGGEFGLEEISSTNLGDHSRRRGGLYLEYRLHLTSGLELTPGASAYKYTDYEWQFSPGFDLGYQLSQPVRVYFSVGKSFRVPSYTDLYYSSMANIGLPELSIERSYNYETGLRYSTPSMTTAVSGFLRNGRNLIDWTRTHIEDSEEPNPWQATNISKMTTQGVEFNWDLRPDNIWESSPIKNINLSYTFLSSTRETGQNESKYILDHLEHQLSGNIALRWLPNLTQSVTARYAKRLTGTEFAVVDSRMTWRTKYVEIFAEVTNLFDRDYIEAGFVPMPGRWLKGGFRLQTGK